MSFLDKFKKEHDHNSQYVVDQNKEPEKGLLGKFVDKIGDNVANGIAQANRQFGTELDAMVREAAKDIRGKVFEAAFGVHEGPGEPGTPMNQMTQREIYETKKEKSKDKEIDLDM